MTVARLVARAEDELGAARLLADGGFAAQAVSRAYYGAFYLVRPPPGSATPTDFFGDGVALRDDGFGLGGGHGGAVDVTDDVALTAVEDRP